MEFQQKGRLTEARDILRTAIPALRAAAGRPELARALGTAGQVSISLGDYHSAAEQAGEAVGLCRSLRDAAHLADNLTTLGLAHLYLGHYPASITAYRQALAVDIARGSTEGEVTLLNNIGNAFYFQGRYLDALDLYRQLGPVKALQMYRAAQSLFATDRHRDGEIGALRNTGIALAMESRGCTWRAAGLHHGIETGRRVSQYPGCCAGKPLSCRAAAAYGHARRSSRGCAFRSRPDCRRWRPIPGLGWVPSYAEQFRDAIDRMGNASRQHVLEPSETRMWTVL